MKIAGLVFNIKAEKISYSFYPHASYKGRDIGIAKGSVLDKVTQGQYWVEAEILENGYRARATKIAPKRPITIAFEGDKITIKGNYVSSEMKITNVEETFDTLQEAGVFVKNNQDNFEVFGYNDLIHPTIKSFLADPSIEFPEETVIEFGSNYYTCFYRIDMKNLFWNGIYIKQFYEMIYAVVEDSTFPKHPEFKAVETPTGVKITLRNLVREFSIEELQPVWFSELEKADGVIGKNQMSRWTFDPKWNFRLIFYNENGDVWSPKEGDPDFYATSVKKEIYFGKTLYKEAVLSYRWPQLKQAVEKPGDWDIRDDDPYYDANNWY